ncbi:Rieske 2Fe-2S domain-containing protein [Allocoleopsis franciscana]|uniref:Ferredoxin subunit of nitrite reductase and ring-hydroxylating dioxygenase n=1 Tax=Allocoleopsis franciscana PCC 7113 TaxID=1173027 RepID=K9WLM7_9CYAN|nr:Rieske 2Fe-2S domain-containing protein [Allocoleopsis franciscana]AFZ20711.1 ferredoxin subunit of nitrite reductase and ring-hydroxylating dioxygenase [Allocoleopsis franciscana PCC 7113]
MTTELKNPVNNDLLAELNNKHYLIVHNFTQKQFYYDSIKQMIFDGIEQIEGVECRRSIEKHGLATMHKYFPVDKVFYLDIFIRKHIHRLQMELAYSFCKNDLKVSTEFFIAPEALVVKICYPFEVAVKSKVTYQQYEQYQAQQLKLSKPFNLKESLKAVKVKTKNLLQKPQTHVGYHDHYPYAAHAYAPHLDSWYRVPLNGINLWWAIAGVQEDNSMVFYPEAFGRYIQYQRDIAYIPPGNTLPKPHKLQLQDGSIFVFNSDLLHGSHLNISNLTRIALSPRVILQKPTFYPDSSNREYSGWHSSKDIGRGEFEKLIKFPKKENWGTLYEGRQKPYVEKRISITLNSSLSEVTPIALCPSDTLSVGEKMLVNFRRESIVILRTIEGLRAVSALCPHLKANLIDGFHDEQHIYCPGHAVTFSLTDGSSKCNLLKVRVYNVYDHDGQILIEKAVNQLDAHLDKSHCTEL